MPIAASILAGCASATESASPTPAGVATPDAAASPADAFGGTVGYQDDGAPVTTVVDLGADGASVSGTAVTTFPSGTHTVALECAARDGETWAIAGTTRETTVPGERAGDWSAVIVRDGSPQRVAIWLSDDKVAGVDCDGWLAAIDMSTIDASSFDAVESGELVSPPDITSSSPSSAPLAVGTFRFPPMHADVELGATELAPM